MILDTSAVIAILRDEPEAPLFAQAIEKAVNRRISAVTYAETAALIDASRDPIAFRRFDDLLQDAEVTVESVTEAQARCFGTPMEKSAASLRRGLLLPIQCRYPLTVHQDSQNVTSGGHIRKAIARAG
jgi:predicted nucleic acid-binding protein